MLQDINPRHRGVLARHSIGKTQYARGRKLSPLEVECTTSTIMVFHDDMVYILIPTKFNPPVRNKVNIRRPWVYDRDKTGKYLGKLITTKISKMVNMDELYLAVARETNLSQFNYGQTAYRLVELFNNYLPECKTELMRYDGHVRSAKIEFNGDVYSMSLTRSGDIKVFNESTYSRVFVSLTPEGILSWFLAKKLNKPQSGVTRHTLWTANSRLPVISKELINLETDHLYNIGNWITSKLCNEPSCYGSIYTVDLIECVHSILCERMQLREIN